VALCSGGPVLRWPCAPVARNTSRGTTGPSASTRAELTCWWSRSPAGDEGQTSGHSSAAQDETNGPGRTYRDAGDRAEPNGGGGATPPELVPGTAIAAGSLAVGLIRHPRPIYLATAALAFGIALTLTALAPGIPAASVSLLITGFAAFCFVTTASTTLQLHSAPAFRGRIMALWVFVYLGTTPIGSILTGWLMSAGGPRTALWVGAGSCLLAAAIAFRVHTPPHPDAALTDLGTN
jgi:hypothetical protein